MNDKLEKVASSHSLYVQRDEELGGGIEPGVWRRWERDYFKYRRSAV